MTLTRLGRTARLAVTIFLVCCAANGFFCWSVPAWFGLFGPPDGLVSPGVDKWLVGPLACVIYVLQYPSYWVTGQTRWWNQWSTGPFVILTSILSATLYTGIIVSIKMWRARRRGTVTREAA